MMITRFTTIASTGRRRKMSVNFMSVVLGSWAELRVGLHAVVDRHGRAVTQLERAGADQLLPRGDAVDDGHEVAAGLAEAHELLARDFDDLAVGCLSHARRVRL